MKYNVLEHYRVDPTTECWQWLGPRRNGYGRCRLPGSRKLLEAHRVFYERHIGAIPGGLDVHHRCANRGCVNPAHLEAVARGEHIRENGHGRTVLTWPEVREIRRVMDELCAEYGVSPSAIRKIADRTTWPEP